jgi:formylglycine-generating enzyme required for sulfatase activity
VQSAAGFKTALVTGIMPVAPKQSQVAPTHLAVTQVTATQATPAIPVPHAPTMPPIAQGRSLPWAWIGGLGAVALLCFVLFFVIGGGRDEPDVPTAPVDSRAAAQTLTQQARSGSTKGSKPTSTDRPIQDTDTARPAFTDAPPATAPPRPTDTPLPAPTFTFTLQPSNTPDLRPSPGDTQISSIDGMALVYIDNFWIDQTEVTNGMYALCVRAGACQPPAESSSYTITNYYGNPAYDRYPVVKVDVGDAKNYCRWAGRHLPSNGEWGGAAGRSRYPWGDSNATCGLANIKINDAFCVGDSTAVGSYPSGASPYGVLDLAGNVFEWIDQSCAQGYIVRGGSWNDGPEMAANSETYCRTDDSSSSKLGFRCAQ